MMNSLKIKNTIKSLLLILSIFLFSSCSVENTPKASCDIFLKKMQNLKIEDIKSNLKDINLDSATEHLLEISNKNDAIKKYFEEIAFDFDYKIEDYQIYDNKKEADVNIIINSYDLNDAFKDSFSDVLSKTFERAMSNNPMSEDEITNDFFKSILDKKESLKKTDKNAILHLTKNDDNIWGVDTNSNLFKTSFLPAILGIDENLLYNFQ
ncbi:MAG: hypothetical protein SOZ89_02315 [Peptoniphilaceae bacterium]|nr:hypothetical protein [Peptoniphilaceae bacterium]MDD7382782.1 hypothetical protein [Peptoniphilaceae bacterium]MDY3737938.1 hypothetical protein [Peptoniphilaceae bacterium]